jgi:hypothetical protein
VRLPLQHWRGRGSLQLWRRAVGYLLIFKCVATHQPSWARVWN